MTFKNRVDAGEQLAKKCAALKLNDVLVFALPRGGAVVGGEVAKSQKTKLDLVICRKITHQSDPEYAIAAVAEENTVLKNEKESRLVSSDWLAVAINEGKWANKKRRKLYFGDKVMTEVENKTVLLVDDGIATGLTMMAAIKEMRNRNAKRIIVAIPVSPANAYWAIKDLADEVVCLKIDESFIGSVSAYYDDFSQVSDEEVIAVLKSVNGH